jgi:chromosome segregation ATPase
MSNIRKSKNREDMPDFDKMWGEVQEEIQEKDAEDAVVNRAPELRTLSENIDKATNTWINATLELESAIQQYQRAERKLDDSVTTIRGKVDNINEHIDNLLKEAPDKLKVSVNVADADWKKIQDLFDKEHKWMLAKMQEHIREVNGMFIEERRRVQERYKEYDGTYLGHYVQYFFWFFFVLGLVIFGLAIFLMLDSHYHWTK